VTAFRDRIKSLVWLALLAMCGVALGPSISRMLSQPASASPASMHEHHMDMASHGHTDMGSHAQMMAGAKADHSDAPADSSCFLDCCALCAVAASPFTGVAVFVALWLPVERAAPPQADHSSAQPDERELWSSASPRGPPPLS
jgi:Protein of unknown function (DUF2946)